MKPVIVFRNVESSARGIASKVSLTFLLRLVSMFFSVGNLVLMSLLSLFDCKDVGITP